MKYAPPNPEGLKPYVVTVSSWGRKHDLIVYAKSSADAKYKTIGRQRHTYATARRATPDDVAEQEPTGGEG